LTEQQGQPIGGDAAGGPGTSPGGPSEEERLRAQQAAYEAELSRISATDMIAQAAVSLLNIGARRLAPEDPAAGAGAGGPAGVGPGAGAPPQRDLAQARDAIDAVKALLDILERTIPQELGPLRDALSRLQMAYAREAPSAAADASGQQPTGQPAAATKPPAAAGQVPQEEGSSGGPGPAESSGRLWVPGR
jgi:hypothetical protein